MSSESVPATAPTAYIRPVQLVVGIICMVMIANLQYGWTLFVNPIDLKHHWGRAAIQVAFTIFVLTETWLVPVEGWLVDRFGLKIVVLVGGILVAIASVLNSVADALTTLYVAAAIGGIGAGAVYGTCVGNALKWFPDRSRPRRRSDRRWLWRRIGFNDHSDPRDDPDERVRSAFLWFGLGQGLVVVALSCLLRAPRPGEAPPSIWLRQSSRDYTPLEALSSPIFWVMYVMFVLVGAGGLMATAQRAPIAIDFQIAKIPVSLLGLILPALTFALSIDRVLNGLTRPFFGWASDHIGRENTMFIAFGFEAAGIWALSQFGRDHVLFVIRGGVVFFSWGEIYSLFPSTCTDVFGVKYATTNAGLLYTAKGTASLLVPLANVLAAASGDWRAVFLAAALMNVAPAIMALAVLKPLRAFHDKTADRIRPARLQHP
jgi:OFA family oxalate/formate antiporter-like MFS transporter